MIEVFKTTVSDKDLAHRIVDELETKFPGFVVNFDLEDCDNILRIKSVGAPITPDPIINVVKEFGFNAEVLPDVVEVSYTLGV